MLLIGVVEGLSGNSNFNSTGFKQERLLRKAAAKKIYDAEQAKFNKPCAKLVQKRLLSSRDSDFRIAGLC